MENTKEWIDVIDTAVKIGLGSLITGTFTYIGIKVSQDSQQKKFILEHKMKVLEDIADNVEIYFNAWTKLNEVLSGTAKQSPHDQEVIKFNTTQLEKIKERDDELTESWGNKKLALSKLRLLQARSAGEALLECSKLENKLRDKIIFEKKYSNYNEMKEIQKEAGTAQRKFHHALSDFYQELLV